METKAPLDSSKAQSVNELVAPTAEAGAADAPEIEVLLQNSGASVSETPFTVDEESSNVTNKSSTPPRVRLTSDDCDVRASTSAMTSPVHDIRSEELRLKRCRTLPHNNFRSQTRDGRSPRSSFRSKSRAPQRATRHASFKDNTVTQAMDRSLNVQLEAHCSNYAGVTSLSVDTTERLRETASPLGSRHSSRNSSQRRQSAWSGDQMRADFDEASRKYFNPETVIGVSAVALVLGFVLSVISFDRPARAWRWLGVCIMCLGALFLVIGGAWFYRQSLLRGRHSLSQGRKLRRKLHIEGESFLSHSPEPSAADA